MEFFTGNDVPGDLHLRVRCEENDADAQTVEAHLIVLRQSPYFESQLRFAASAPVSVGEKRPREALPEVVFTVDDASEIEVALRVVASFPGYNHDEGLVGLPSQDLVIAHRIADVLCMPALVENVLDIIKNRPMDDDLFRSLTKIGSWADDMLPLVNAAVRFKPDATDDLFPMVHAYLCDLEAVWYDPIKTKTLLELPRPLFTRLLNTSNLHVASEDTVLYAAYRYAQQNEFHEDIIDTVRVCHLSLHQLTSQAASGLEVIRQGAKGILNSVRRELPLVVNAKVNGISPHLLEGIPVTWKFPPRNWILPARTETEVQVAVPVSRVKAALRRRPNRAGRIPLRDEGDCTGPLSGFAWKVSVWLQADEARGDDDVFAVMLSMVNAPQMAFFKCKSVEFELSPPVSAKQSFKQEEQQAVFRGVPSSMQWYPSVDLAANESRGVNAQYVFRCKVSV